MKAAGQRCLQAETDADAPTIHPCSSELSAGARQIWILHRLGEGRLEIRNVATAQSIALIPSGKLATLMVDGGHVAPLRLRLAANGVCVEGPQEATCADAPQVAVTPGAGDLLHLIAP